MSMISATAFLLMMGNQATMEAHALKLDVIESENSVLIELMGESETRQVVRYEIEIIGSSRAKHSGRTTLPAGPTTSLSSFNVSHSGKWCAIARIEEENGASYVLQAGDCDPQQNGT